MKIGVEIGPEAKEMWNDMVVGQKQVLSLWNLPTGTVVKTVYAYSNADGMDLQYVNVYAQDAAGNRVPTATDEVSFEVVGAARLHATDDGDHYTATTFGISKRKMSRGFAQAILRTTRAPGEVTLKVSSPTLGERQVMLTTRRPANSESVAGKR